MTGIGGAEPRILVSWYIDPRYIPPFRLSARQVTVGPLTRPGQPRELFDAVTPLNRYDLKAALAGAGVDPRFDLIVVFADAAGSNRPLNLEAFACPKLLCVGDTHHLNRPLSRLVPYARSAGFDAVLLTYTRQHMHWFAAPGMPRVAWIPGLTVRHLPWPWRDDRARQVAFIGLAGDHHPRRRFLLAEMRRRGLPVIAREASREEGAELYAGSLASFNCSLNGDLNMRIFEVLSAGGCLLTDRLAPEAGLGLLFEEGRDFLGYDTAEELIDQARFLLGNPARALALARSGHAAYEARFRPERQAAALLGWALEGRIDPRFAPEGDPRHAAPVPLARRLALYDALQEAHRLVPRPQVLFAAELDPVHARDALDLPRLTRAVAPLAPALQPPMPAEERILRLSRAEALARRWDIVVAPEGAALPEGLAHGMLVRA